MTRLLSNVEESEQQFFRGLEDIAKEYIRIKQLNPSSLTIVKYGFLIKWVERIFAEGILTTEDISEVLVWKTHLARRARGGAPFILGVSMLPEADDEILGGEEEDT